jgi:CBS domain-containing protein
MHVGGMSPDPGPYDVAGANDRLLEELRLLDTQGVDLLLENLPPYPWYFGGKWYGHVITNGADTEYLCRDSGYGLCFDTSHAALECNRSGADLTEFAVKVAPFVRHLHVSDAAGTAGEGLQIGEGTINFVDLLPALLANGPTLVPEVWMGHHGEGRGFRQALDHLTDVMWATKALRRADLRTGVPELQAMTIPIEATILGALQRIDANRMGIGFVVDTIGVVRGVVTDGDIRHGIVRGRNLHSSVSEIMTREFVFAEAGCADDELRARLSGRSRVLPVLAADGRLVDFASDLRIPAGPGAMDVRPDRTAL